MRSQDPYERPVEFQWFARVFEAVAPQNSSERRLHGTRHYKTRAFQAEEMHYVAILGRSAMCFDFVQKRLSRICFENQYAAHTPILPNLNFIPWWRSEARFSRMCAKPMPDNEIQILRFFGDAWMHIWCTFSWSKSPALLLIFHWMSWSWNTLRL